MHIHILFIYYSTRPAKKRHPWGVRQEFQNYHLCCARSLAERAWMLLFHAALVPSLLRSAVHPRMAAAAGVAASPPPPSAIGGDELALGFDFGTSGARCAVVDASGAVVCEPAAYAWGGEQERKQTAEAWVDALHSLLDALPAELCGRVRRIAVSGTSSSVVLCDRRDGTPAAGRGLPRMYDFSVSKQAAAGAGDAALQLIGEHAPPKHTVSSPTSALAKLLLALALRNPSPTPQPNLGPSPSPSPSPDPSLTLTRCARPPRRSPSFSRGMRRRRSRPTRSLPTRRVRP